MLVGLHYLGTCLMYENTSQHVYYILVDVLCGCVCVLCGSGRVYFCQVIQKVRLWATQQAPVRLKAPPMRTGARKKADATLTIIGLCGAGLNDIVMCSLASTSPLYPDSKNFGKWMRPIWQAHLGESLVMLIGPSWAPKCIALLGTNLGPIRERRCLP